MKLEAVYVAENETVNQQVVIDMSADNTTAGNVITWIPSWNVPSAVGTFVAGGVLLVETKYYNPETFKVGGNGANVTQAAPGAIQKAEQPGYGLGKGNSFVGTTWYGMAWVQYKEAVTGETITVYSDLVECTKY